MGIGGINKGLIGEIELGRPIENGAPRELVPFLVLHAPIRIAISLVQKFTRNVDEVFSIVRPAQSRRQFKVANDIVIRFAERGV